LTAITKRLIRLLHQDVDGARRSPAKALDQWARGAAEFERMALER